jgi:hypothetical protein
MPNIIELTIESSTETVNGNFANKLVGKTEGVKTAFGEVEGGKRTFYMFTDTENTKGTKGPVDLDQFDTVKNEYPFTDDKGEEQIAMLSYLYPKRTT